MYRCRPSQDGCCFSFSVVALTFLLCFLSVVPGGGICLVCLLGAVILAYLDKRAARILKRSEGTTGSSLSTPSH